MESITSTLKYDQYSDSGYEWIGEIPEHWDLVKLGSCLSPVSVKNCPELPLLSITREQGVIERDVDNQESNHNFIPDDLSGYKKLEKGQFGMNKMKAWQGSYGVSKFTGIVSPAYFIFDFTKAINPEFFNWAIRSKLYVSFFGSASDGVRIGQWDLSKARMKLIPFVLPSEEEQSLIANFLDKKATQINDAISIKEKQINLLKEHKQIIIQQAVTQGLDPNVPMKDSGVDWIGEIPEHWEVKRIKHAGKIINGYAFPSDAFIQEGARVMKISNIQTMRLDWSDSSYVDALWLTKTNQFRIYKGDLVFALTRPVISTGIKAALVDTDEPILLNQRNAVFRPNDTCDKNWIYFVLLTKGFINDFEMQIDITGQQPNISTVAIGNLSFPLPPELEQKAIVSDLSRRCALLDKAVDDQIAQIEKLKEYKTTLINSAVTGKIKITPEMVEQ
ncbi:restriction endonuclease subunit S [Escherichia coli]|uniref:restriction endonuclease subunit S n=1 Tax=Escherichia coli TaxID=562 RepID=UPI00128EF733|nr:restriction endonuclease subunit S [Escherichia coli]MCH6618196.1 restriction endonuclease subunit S [Escherichia coli]MCM2759531.1 restriction endonuclease subunit S [Escherichia coli]MCX3542055.1 restriction endonuclease subunit S [Escherichia coli]MQK49215.1 restriction endonuclease subunit S [Escherichia coli]